jgi:MFS superfamily sulfate permease-like transporter
MISKICEKLYEDSWTALVIEFLLFITIASVSAIVLTIFSLTIGIYFGVAFGLGIMVERIQQKRKEHKAL